MGEVMIESKTLDPGVGWTVQCVIIGPDRTVRGPQFVAAPDEATDEELKTALLALYGL